MRCIILLLAMMWCTSGSAGAHADEINTVSLSCGGTRFTAISHSVHTYATAQEIWAYPASARYGHKVDLREFTFGLRHGVPGLTVLADRIGLWGCATTSKGSILILWYDCPRLLPEDVPSHFCSDSGEWYRYVAPNGSLLDKGFGLGRGLRDSDPRERGLRVRLGLPPDDENVRFKEVL